MDGIEQVEPWLQIEAATRLVNSAGEEPIEAVGDLLPKFYQRRLEWRRQWTLMRLAVALATYGLEKGEYPDRLEDLAPGYVPAVGLDPMNGRPISYLKRLDHAIVYSFGDDGDDDGGRPLPDDYSTADGDIAWIVKRRGAGVK